mmetsp:Transcript_38924/g.87126  ORF Transcript_38924/g.87126 Transcript_38924/m.87126 type:complete len:110 (-) Transcript_38924:41-370(-)
MLAPATHQWLNADLMAGMKSCTKLAGTISQMVQKLHGTSCVSILVVGKWNRQTAVSRTDDWCVQSGWVCWLKVWSASDSFLLDFLCCGRIVASLELIQRVNAIQHAGRS